MSRPETLLPFLREHQGWTEATLRALYAWWGWRHAEAASDPILLKLLERRLQDGLYTDFRRYLDTDEGPLGLGIYADGRCGWDSLDPLAEEVRRIAHFLRVSWWVD